MFFSCYQVFQLESTGIKARCEKGPKEMRHKGRIFLSPLFLKEG
jgi:hypothetical protein